MKDKKIVLVQDDVVDGVIIHQVPLKALYYTFKALDFILVIAFFAVSRWLLKESINPMFGLSVLLVRFLWHGLDARVRKSLGIETPTRKSEKRG